MESRIDQEKGVAYSSDGWIWRESWNDRVDRGHNVGQLSDPGIQKKEKTVIARCSRLNGREVYLGRA